MKEYQTLRAAFNAVSISVLVHRPSFFGFKVRKIYERPLLHKTHNKSLKRTLVHERFDLNENKAFTVSL